MILAHVSTPHNMLPIRSHLLCHMFKITFIMQIVSNGEVLDMCIALEKWQVSIWRSDLYRRGKQLRPTLQALHKSSKKRTVLWYEIGCMDTFVVRLLNPICSLVFARWLRLEKMPNVNTKAPLSEIVNKKPHMTKVTCDWVCLRFVQAIHTWYNRPSYNQIKWNMNRHVTSRPSSNDALLTYRIIYWT